MDDKNGQIKNELRCGFDYLQDVARPALPLLKWHMQLDVADVHMEYPLSISWSPQGT